MLQLHVCEMILEREGVHGYVSCDEFSLDLIPLDRDLLSLEMPHFFRSCYLVICFVIYQIFASYAILLRSSPSDRLHYMLHSVHLSLTSCNSSIGDDPGKNLGVSTSLPSPHSPSPPLPLEVGPLKSS